MPGSYLIDVPEARVFSRAWGALTDAEVLAHAKTLGVDARFAPSFGQVLDFQSLGAIHLTTEGIVALAHSTPFDRDARRAVVVASDLAFGLTRMFELYSDADPAQFTIVRDLASAMRWVGLEPTEPWPPHPPDATFSVP